MSRRFPVTIFIAVLAVIFLVIAIRVSLHTGPLKINQVSKRMNAPSELYARMTIRYDKPPIYSEEWWMQDVEGVSNYRYTIRSYSGKQIAISIPDRRIYDVSYFFGALSQDGVWQIVDQAPRPNSVAQYTVYVKQLADLRQGERTVTFTDPKFWATAGQQFEIDLKKNAPSDFLRLHSTQGANPHYEAVVQDFLTFGPQAFRDKIAQARASLGAPAR